MRLLLDLGLFEALPVALREALPVILCEALCAPALRAPLDRVYDCLLLPELRVALDDVLLPRLVPLLLNGEFSRPSTIISLNPSCRIVFTISFSCFPCIRARLDSIPCGAYRR